MSTGLPSLCCGGWGWGWWRWCLEGSVVAEVVHTMQDIHTSSRRINDIMACLTQEREFALTGHQILLNR